MMFAVRNFLNSFYSAPFYRALIISGKGLGVGFIVLVALITTAQALQREDLRTAVNDLSAFYDELPPLEIVDGVIKIEGQTPRTFVLLSNFKGKPLQVVFDTESEAADVKELKTKMQDENILALVNKKAVTIYNLETKEISRTIFDKAESTKISHEQWVSLWRMMLAVLVPTVIFMGFLVALVMHFLLACAGGLLLFIISPLFKTVLDFSSALRLTAVAKLPIATISLLLPEQPALLALLWFGFAVFGLLSAKTLAKET